MSKDTPTQHLPNTLAQRVQHFRDQLGLSQEGLASQANLPLEQVRDIESGLELFLSPSIRQKLARVLKVKPTLLQEVEKIPEAGMPQSAQMKRQTQNLLEYMIVHPGETYYCPQCEQQLVVRFFNRRDLEDNLLVEVKAHCPHCLFRLQS